MASLRTFPRSPYFFACLTLPDGRRVQRSTKETKRKAAQAKADKWESLSKERAKARQAHRVIADIYKAAHNKDLPDATVRSFITAWLERRKGELSPASHAAYKGASERFLNWLKEGANRPIAEIETCHFVSFRDDEVKRVSAATANKFTKMLRVIFEDARRDGYTSENPAKDCPRLKKAVRETMNDRRPFTLDEMRRIIAAADDEMRSLVMFGLYTGQRLGDLARLTWANLDLTAEEVHLTTGKTGRVVRIPLAAPLLAHILTLPAGDNPRAFLHPRAAASSQPTNSNRFGDLLANLGLLEARPHTAREDGKGRAARRNASQISFHSLRHTATSLMKNAGISPAIVQDIIGHDSAEMSAHYTHVESASKRAALSTLPDLTR